MAGGCRAATVQLPGATAVGTGRATANAADQEETIMRLMNRKLGVLAAGTLVAAATATATTHYAIEQLIPTYYASGTAMCSTIGTDGQPYRCVSIDPSRFGFAALRGM